MTTIDFNEALIDTLRPTGPGLFARLFARFRKRREQELTLYELSRLDAHLLRDIGIEPMDVYDALNQHRGHSILLNPMRRTGDNK